MIYAGMIIGVLIYAGLGFLCWALCRAKAEYERAQARSEEAEGNAGGINIVMDGKQAYTRKDGDRLVSVSCATCLWHKKAGRTRMCKCKKSPNYEAYTMFNIVCDKWEENRNVND